jgi:RNA polymerase sigma factor (sigma-70 family)
MMAVIHTDVTTQQWADDFEFAIQRESARLYALALTILRDHREAEDACQETMIRAWRNWSKLRDPSDPSPWLTRICVNRCLSRRRSLLAARARTVPLGVNDRSTRVVSTDLNLAAAFERLSSRQRTVLTLHYQFGYTLDESAVLMGCRPGTARSHLARGLASLRRNLSND